MTRITRTLTAAGLGAEPRHRLLSASSATPARANNDEAVAIIGGLDRALCHRQAIQNNNRNTTVTPQLRASPAARRMFRTVPVNWWRRRGASSRGGTRTGSIAAMSAAACRTTQARPALLPQNCLRRVETQRGPRLIYRGRCLAQNGWVREAGFRP